MTNYAFKLYIAGKSVHSDAAIQNLGQICEQLLGNKCNITILDVLESPDEADADHILATPTLIRIHPPPTRRVIGDLSNIQKVLISLGIQTDNLPKEGNSL